MSEPLVSVAGPGRRAPPELLLVGILVAAVLAIGLLALSPAPVGVYFDDGVYVILAKALATGEGLRYLNLPGSPPAAHFPPAYPLLLAGLWRLDPSFPANVALFKFVNIGLLGAAAALAYGFATRRLALGPVAAFLAVLFGTGSYLAVFLAGAVMSETLFLVLLLATLWAGEELLDAPSVGRSLAVGVLAGVLPLTRWLGFAVLPAVVILLAWRRQRVPALVVLLTSLLFLVPWQLWVSAHSVSLPPELRGNYGPYAPWLMSGLSAGGAGFLLRIASQNLAAVGLSLQPLRGAAVPAVLWAATALLAAIMPLVGAALAFRRARATVLSLGAYLLIVLCWPFPPERFVWAVWPLLILLWAVGLGAVLRWRPARASRRVAQGALLAGTLVAAAGHGVVGAHVLKGDAPWRVVPRVRGTLASPVVRWVVTHTGPGAIVVTDHGLANLVALYTGRKVLPAQDPQADWSLAEPPLTYHAYYLARLLRQWDICCVVVVGPPALEAAVRLASGPSPRLVLVERFPEGGGAFAVVGRGSPSAEGVLPGKSGEGEAKR